MWPTQSKTSVFLASVKTNKQTAILDSGLFHTLLYSCGAPICIKEGRLIHRFQWVWRRCLERSRLSIWNLQFVVQTLCVAWGSCWFGVTGGYFHPISRSVIRWKQSRWIPTKTCCCSKNRRNLGMRKSKVLQEFWRFLNLVPYALRLTATTTFTIYNRPFWFCFLWREKQCGSRYRPVGGGSSFAPMTPLDPSLENKNSVYLSKALLVCLVYTQGAEETSCCWKRCYKQGQTILEATQEICAEKTGKQFTTLVL